MTLSVTLILRKTQAVPPRTRGNSYISFIDPWRRHTLTEVVIPYTPRPLQNDLHTELDKHRWAVIVCHRRFGKTVMAINHLLRASILSEKKNPRFSYIAPTYRQAKSVAWDYIKQFTSKIPNIKYNETELRCDLPNGARITLLGSENPDSLRGIYLDGCVIDEVADMPESVFPEVIRPALSDRKGFCYFIGTPKGHNMFYDLYENGEQQPEWYTALYKASETNILDEEELRQASQTMSPDQYNQEFECSWVANIPGSIYGSEMEELQENGKITTCPYDPSLRVDTYWDLGLNDSTAIWFAQTSRGGAVSVIDYYEVRNEGLPHFVHVLEEKEYLYGTHNAPHDIEVRELGTGRSRREVAYDLGINFRVVPKLPLEDGIHAVKMMLPRCTFDIKNCKEGIESLRHYHRAYNERTRTFRATPVHDWTSHGADAFRYMAVGLKQQQVQQAPQSYADNKWDPLGSDKRMKAIG